MNRINLGSLIIKVIVAGMLLLAVFGRHPYSFYTLLRWVACGACAYTAFQAIESKKTGWVFIFLNGAVMLNPIAPLRFKRETWGIDDASSAVLLLAPIPILDIRNSRQ